MCCVNVLYIGLNGLIVPVNTLCCPDSHRLQSVIVSDVPIDPDKVRKKLLMLEALANLLSGRPEREMVVSGRKKHATAQPCNSWGLITPIKSMPTVKVMERQ